MTIPEPALNPDPHIVLLHIGTNDMRNPNGAPDRLATLMDQILTTLPDSLLVVSSMSPGNQGIQGLEITFHEAMHQWDEEIDSRMRRLAEAHGLKFNDLQVVSTDHCPFCMADQKILGKDDFSKIPNGAPGIETRLTLVHDGGVRGEVAHARALARGGRLVTYGATTGPRGDTDLRVLFWKQLRIIGIHKVRGFMLNVTHHDWTRANVQHGLEISRMVGGKPFVVTGGPGQQTNGSVSPDGRWLAYVEVHYHLIQSI